MFVLDLERDLPVEPERAFALISDPDLMNRWSEARIERVAAGDGGHAGGTGALRRVHARIAGRTTVLDEVIERSEAPSELRYRVIAPSSVKRHAGVQTITATAGGSKVRWRVEVELSSRPLEWIAKAALRAALERSMDAMARVAAEGGPPRALPPRRTLDEAAEARALRAEAEACLAAEGRRAEELLERHDDRGWFARIYQHVTEAQLRTCAEGRVEHPAWVLRMVIAAHALWDENLAYRLGERGGDVERHWVRAHAKAERGTSDGADVFARATRSIVAGLRAHIEDDLPRAIAKVHLRSYVGRADLARFRADYLRMGEAFATVGARLGEVVPREHWPRKVRALDVVTSEGIRTSMIDRAYYPIEKRRTEAFERAVGLLRVLAD